MIPREQARKLVARFSGTRGYPDTTEGLASLVTAFQRFADSETHALEIADDLLVETEFCPRPAEIRRVALATRSESEASDCPKCNGTGFTYIQRDGVAHARKCECRL